MNFEIIFKITGVVFWLLTALVVFLRIIFGKKWIPRTIYRGFFGTNLTESISKFSDEIERNSVKKSTVVDLAFAIFKRLTRIGIFAILISLVPFILLMQQNLLLKNQNKLFKFQNTRIDKQTQLDSVSLNFISQQTKLINEQIEVSNEQTKLLNSQNELFDKQNSKIEEQLYIAKLQNRKFDKQNEYINIQNNLAESTRKSSLVFLLSNILDNMDKEIKQQREKLTYKENNLKYEFKLSDELISRIVAISKAFEPYSKIDSSGSLSNELISPERGQLLIALTGVQLDSLSSSKIFKTSNFDFANVGDHVFRTKYLNGLKLNNANLSGSIFKNTQLIEVEISNSDLSYCKFKNCSFSTKGDSYYTNLKSVEMDSVNFDLLGASFESSNMNNLKCRNCKGHFTAFNSDLTSAELGDSISFYGFDNNLYQTEFKGNLWESTFDNCYGNPWFQRTTITDAYFRNCNFSYCHFESADLNMINIDSIKCIGRFRYANLNDVTFNNSILKESEFSESTLNNVSMCNVDLSKAWSARISEEVRIQLMIDYVLDVEPDSFPLTLNFFKGFNQLSNVKGISQLTMDSILISRPSILMETNCSTY